jgi:hypothetical protein
MSFALKYVIVGRRKSHSQSARIAATYGVTAKTILDTW